jgi:F420-dependent oxidoreductase-like protein
MEHLTMKFGIQHPNFTHDGKGAELVDGLKLVATRAETAGFDSFWVMDHFHQIQHVGQPHEPMLESWTTLATLAGLTSRIKLGTLVTGIVYRYPSILAKIGATLDVLSKGRLFMGIGAAWNEEESKAYGIAFPKPKERLQRLEEAVQIIQRMWTEKQVSFDGKFYTIRDAFCEPKPIQKPHPPILIGGAGERETLRIVAKYADACNLFGSPNTIRSKLQILRNHCKRVGRDYDAILKTKLGTVIIDDDLDRLQRRIAERFKDFPENMRSEMITYGRPDDVHRQIEAFREAGIEYFITNFEPERELEALDLFGNTVVKQL